MYSQKNTNMQLVGLQVGQQRRGVFAAKKMKQSDQKSPDEAPDSCHALYRQGNMVN